MDEQGAAQSRTGAQFLMCVGFHLGLAALLGPLAFRALGLWRDASRRHSA